MKKAGGYRYKEFHDNYGIDFGEVQKFHDSTLTTVFPKNMSTEFSSSFSTKYYLLLLERVNHLRREVIPNIKDWEGLTLQQSPVVLERLGGPFLQVCHALQHVLSGFFLNYL